MLQIYDESEMLKGKLDLLSNTNMVDFAMDVYQNLYPDQEVPQSMDLLICTSQYCNLFFRAMLKLHTDYCFTCGSGGEVL